MRVAIHEDGRWVEILVEGIEVIPITRGRAISISGVLEDCAEEIALPYAGFLIEPDKREPISKLRNRALGEPATPPTWGGLDPKDAAPVDEPVLRFFTLTLVDGSLILNQHTTKGATVAEASAAVRKTWGMLGGKAITECDFQPEGRRGEDKPRAAGAFEEGEVRAYEGAGTVPEAGTGGCTLFRWHRGALADSMDTVVPCESLGDLLAILRKHEDLGKLELAQVDVKKYGHDKRIGWDSYLVVVRGVPIGFTNGEL